MHGPPGHCAHPLPVDTYGVPWPLPWRRTLAPLWAMAEPGTRFFADGRGFRGPLCQGPTGPWPKPADRSQRARASGLRPR
eukprot:3978822-Lingulodinium_polyedra.AAC.1